MLGPLRCPEKLKRGCLLSPKGGCRAPKMDAAQQVPGLWYARAGEGRRASPGGTTVGASSLMWLASRSGETIVETSCWAQDGSPNLVFGAREGSQNLVFGALEGSLNLRPRERSHFGHWEGSQS